MSTFSDTLSIAAILISLASFGVSARTAFHDRARHYLDEERTGQTASALLVIRANQIDGEMVIESTCHPQPFPGRHVTSIAVAVKPESAFEMQERLDCLRKTVAAFAAKTAENCADGR